MNLSDIAPDIVAPLTQEGYKYEPFVAILPFETNWCINYMSTALMQVRYRRIWPKTIIYKPMWHKLTILHTSSTNSTIGHDTTPDEQYCMKTAAYITNMGFGPIP